MYSVLIQKDPSDRYERLKFFNGQFYPCQRTSNIYIWKCSVSLDVLCRLKHVVCWIPFTGAGDRLCQKYQIRKCMRYASHVASWLPKPDRVLRRPWLVKPTRPPPVKYAASSAASFRLSLNSKQSSLRDGSASGSIVLFRPRSSAQWSDGRTDGRTYGIGT